MVVQQSLEVPLWDAMDWRCGYFAFPYEKRCFFPDELSCNVDDSLEEEFAAHLQYVLATINIYIPLAFEHKHWLA